MSCAAALGRLSAVELRDMSLAVKLAISPPQHRIPLRHRLPYHGGPGSNFSMHALVAMTRKLRKRRGPWFVATSLAAAGAIEAPYAFPFLVLQVSCSPAWLSVPSLAAVAFVAIAVARDCLSLTHGMPQWSHLFSGSFGLITANGGFLSKHAAGIYSTTPYGETHPRARLWSRRDPAQYQADLDKEPEEEVDEQPNGVGTIETYTVLHNAKVRQPRVGVRRRAATVRGV